MPKISVVVPVYNVERYLAECLDSILAQSLADIEVICVNDGSTDSSPDILAQYAARDARIKIISKPNSGYGHTMNVGFDAACGEYIGIVESDDVVPPDMFGDLCAAADRHGCDIVKADFRTFIDTPDGRVFTLRRLTESVSEPQSYYGCVLRPLDRPEVFKLIMNTWSGIYRRDFLQKHNIRHNETPGASFQDNGLWFQSFALAERVMFLDKPYYMLRRDNAASSVHNRSKVYCLCEEYDFIRDFLARHPDLYERLIGYYWLKKYHNYIWSYRERIGAEYREEFLERFAREFTQAKESGELDLSIFEPWERRAVCAVIDDREAFHRSEQRFLTLLEKLKKPETMSSFEKVLTKLQVFAHDHGYPAAIAHVLKRTSGKNA